MKAKLILAGVVAAGLSGMIADACTISATVACPGGSGAAGIKVCLSNPAGKFPTVCVYTTDSTGFVTFGDEIASDNTYEVCVDLSTLPAGATLDQPCQTVVIPPYGQTVFAQEFDLGGTFCTPPSGLCWETGGGQIDSDGDGDKDSPCEWSFGGVIYPGCSPLAAGGGNLNIVNHTTGAHFKGENFTVVDCRGKNDKSPKVTLNIIDFTGTGEVTTSAGTVNVSFVGTFRDSHDSGSNADGLYLQVTGPSGIISDFSIGTDMNNLFLLSTGNVQIHQTGCGK